MITSIYRNVDKHLHLSLNNTPEHAGSEGKKSGEVKTDVAPDLTPPLLSMSTTRAASATNSAKQHAVNGDNLCGYVCWFMSHAASHRPSSSISQEDRGTPDRKPPPRPLLYRTAKPRQKEQARTQIMFSLAQTTYLNTTRLGSAQFGLKERGHSPVTHSAGLAAGAAQPANTTTTPPPLARGNYPHKPKPTAMSTRRIKIPSPTVHNMHTSTRVPRLVHSRPQRGSDVKDEGMTGKNGNTWLITSLTHRQAFR